MEKTDIKILNTIELENSIKIQKLTLMKLKISNKVAQLQNPIQIRNLRKEIARLSTELSTKELQAK